MSGETRTMMYHKQKLLSNLEKQTRENVKKLDNAMANGHDRVRVMSEEFNKSLDRIQKQFQLIIQQSNTLYEDVCDIDTEITASIKNQNSNFKILELEQSYLQMDQKMRQLQESYEYFKVFEAQLEVMEERVKKFEDRVLKLETASRQVGTSRSG